MTGRWPDGYMPTGSSIPLVIRDGKPMCPCSICCCEEPLVETEPGLWRCPHYDEAMHIILNGFRSALGHLAPDREEPE